MKKGNRRKKGEVYLAGTYHHSGEPRQLDFHLPPWRCRQKLPPKIRTSMTLRECHNPNDQNFNCGGICSRDMADPFPGRSVCEF
jgi:hypothetical protein